MPGLVLGAFAFTEAVTISSLSNNQCRFLFPHRTLRLSRHQPCSKPPCISGLVSLVGYGGFRRGRWFMSYLSQAFWSHFPCQGLFKNGYKRIHQSRCEGKSTRWFLCSQEKIPKRKSSSHWVMSSQMCHLKLPQPPHNGKESSCKDKLMCRRLLRTWDPADI